MRGRRPAGPEYVDDLEGSAQAKERLQVVLATLAGRCRVLEACERLGIKEARFHQLRTEVLEAALQRLEPRPAGRPAHSHAATADQVRALQEELAAKDVELRAAQVRAEVALALPQLRQQPQEPEKKTRPRTRKRR